MLQTNASLFLPVSENTLARVIGTDRELPSDLLKLSLQELAGLLTIQFLPKIKSTQAISPVATLEMIVKGSNDHAKQLGSDDAKSAIVKKIDVELVREGQKLLPDFGIALLEDQTIADREYLDAYGNWDHSFNERHREKIKSHLQQLTFSSGEQRVLSWEQSRLFNEIKSQMDDHIHVQGYAGTGKSLLIRSLLYIFQNSSANILVLAEFQNQLNALLANCDTGAHFSGKTFWQLSLEIIPKDLTSSINQRMSRTNPSLNNFTPYQKIVEGLGIQHHGNSSAMDIARIVEQIVSNFCFSGDDAIDANHIPSQYNLLLDGEIKVISLNYACQYWDAILYPTSEFRPVIQTKHRLKWASMMGCKIPSRYTHVLIDECHNISKAMLQIFDNSHQAIISFGDEYQNLRGIAHSRSETIRQREITHSVRCGKRIEETINNLIATIPGKTKTPFIGNPLQKTDVIYYKKPTIPHHATTIVVGDMWELFEWTQRIVTEGAKVSLLSEKIDLNKFVSDCIELFTHQTRPRHRLLNGFSTWDSIAAKYAEHPGFQRIDRMLKKGYGNADWSNTFDKIEPYAKENYVLVKLHDVRNQEFGNIMLTPGAIGGKNNIEKPNFSTIGNAIYIACTRAKDELILPEQLMGFGWAKP